MKITVKDLIKNTDCKLLNGNLNEEIINCAANTIDVAKGSCFFGVKGKNMDGSLFYKEALEKGAKVLVLSKNNTYNFKGYSNRTILISNDVKKALQDIAKYKRSLFKGIVIGITGSVGKTSTKELISNVLKKKYKVLKTVGNKNSQIGLPLTILRLKDEDVMVLEMGMNEKGQMHKLSLIARPDIAVLTNVLTSHIGNFNSRYGILNAKLEILDGMKEGTLIVNNDNDLLNGIDIYDNVKMMTYGINNRSNVMASNIKCGLKTNFDIDDIKDFEINGPYDFIYNVLPAYLIGKLLGLSRNMIKEGINNSSKISHRLEIVKLKNNVTLIDDTYNASYDSVKAALEYISKYDKRKIVVLGDILELGKKSKEIHKKIGNLIIDNNIDILITIGKYSKYILKKTKKLGMNRKNIKKFKNEESARKYIKSMLKEEDIILLKGSNGMNLVNIVEYLKYE